MPIDIWIWLGAAAVFAVIEGLTVGLVCIWFAAGALAAMLCAILGAGLAVQLTVFVLVSAAALALVRPLARRFSRSGTVATNADRCLGQTARVTEAIDNRLPSGAVYIDGKTWTARSTEADVTIPVGALVTVERMEGVKLYVKFCEKTEEVK